MARILARPRSDWALLGEAVWMAVSARLALWLLPFARVAAGLGHPHAETLKTLSPEQAALARRVGWSVRATGRYLPLRLVCLPQAVAAQRMLARRGIPATLYLGVALGKRHPMTAHAWLRAGRVVVTGNRERAGHAVVATFAKIGPRESPKA